MIDREKVMTWLEICGKNRRCFVECPYGDGSGKCEDRLCREDLMADAFTLLEEQDAVKPVKREMSGMTNDGYQYYTYDCGVCGEPLLLSTKYCDKCGREVKWK
jgi:hypothetical protein